MPSVPPTVPIVLTTINARYTHAALGLRYLKANLGPLREQAAIREFHISQPALQIAEALLAEDPRLIGMGVYIWNAGLSAEVVQIVKALRPEITIVLGGPEASHEYEGTELFARADYLIRGEGEEAFAALARRILAGDAPKEKVTAPPAPDPARLALPYGLYTDEDIAHRRLYVEASRGCPFRCEFCLSSLDPAVREFPLEPFLSAMAALIERGARHFKFVDRTFNLNRDRVFAMLDFFLARWREGMQLHFEIVPDRLSEGLLQAMARFPAAGLHLEVGIQTFNPEVQALISRKQDLPKTIANLRFLRERTQALIHADLIAGLPGESWESFAAGFDRMVSLRPHQIQVGILKRLKGAPIARHALTQGLAFAAHPPYEILATNKLDFAQMQRLRRFARFFDLYYNSENFPRTLELLWHSRASAFGAFMGLADEIWAHSGRTHEFPLLKLAQYLYEFLMREGADEPQTIAAALEQDFYRHPGRKEKLEFLRPGV